MPSRCFEPLSHPDWGRTTLTEISRTLSQPQNDLQTFLCDFSPGSAPRRNEMEQEGSCALSDAVVADGAGSDTGAAAWA